MPSNTVVAAGVPRVTTLTEVLQLPPPQVDAFGQAEQQIGPHGVEQIKRLIEKMGNVQKVNQLVILGLDQLPLHAQCAGLQQPQNLIQPLHFDFTQSTMQHVVHQQTEDKKRYKGTSSTGSEQDKLVEPLEAEVAVTQKETVVEFETNISAECPENQVTIVESDMTEAQVNEVQYELLPDLTERDVLAPQLEASHQLVLITEEQQIQDTIEIKTSETENGSSLITDFESTITCEKDLVINSTDIFMSAMTNINPEPRPSDPEVADLLIEPETQTVQWKDGNADVTNASADPPRQKIFEAVGSSVGPEPQTGLGNVDTLDKTSANPDSQCQKTTEEPGSFVEPQANNEQQNINLDNSQEMEADVEQQPLKEILTAEDQILQMNKPSLCNVQHDQERPPSDHTPCSESSVEQSRVETEDQKVSPVKKKRSKKRLIPESKHLEPQDDVGHGKLSIPPNPKTVTVTKTQKKQEKTKKHFGSKQNKKRYPKQKLLNLSKNSSIMDQQDSDPGNVPVLSNSEVGKNHKKNNKKGRKSEKSSGLIQALNLPSENVMKVSEQAHRGKAQKRKFEKQKGLVKKGKSTQETQPDETPVTKKKKTLEKKVKKITEAAPKKEKNNNKAVNKVNRKSHKLTKHMEKDKNASETPIIDQVKQQALLLLKGHKQPQLKVHKLDAKTTGLDPQLIHKCQTKDSRGHETVVEPAKEGIQNSLQAPGQKRKKAKSIGKKSKVNSKQSSQVLQTSTFKSDDLSGAKQKVVRKRKAPVRIDQEIALSPPYSRLIIGCHDCGKSFSEVSALQEHMALMHSENGALQSGLPCDVSEMPVVGLRPNEIMLTNAVHSSSFEIPVPTDWDVETEMRAIGLEDEQRNEHRLSFPALNPSPSFPLTTMFTEGEHKQDDTLNQEPSPAHKKAIGKNSACHVETNDSKLGDQESVDVPLETPECINAKEALPSDVSLIMVEDQNEGGTSDKVSDPEELDASHALGHSPSLNQNQLPTNPENPASTYNAGSRSTEQSEIKEEADETSVQTVASQANTFVARGKRGRGSKGRGKRQLKKKPCAENGHTEPMVANEEDCQVVFELYSLTGNSEENTEEILRNRRAVNATAASIHSALKESSEVREVSVLPQQVSALESNSDSGSPTLNSGEHDKNISFPSRAKRRLSAHCQSGMRGQVGFY